MTPALRRKLEALVERREEIERLERDLPGMATEQLPLLGDTGRGGKQR